MKTSNRKKWLIALIVLLVLFAAVPIGGYFLERFFIQKLRELIDNRPESVYTYTFAEIDVDLWKGSVAITEVSMHPTKNLLDSAVRNAIPRRTFIDTQIDRVELQGVKIFKFLTTGDLVLGELIINTPQFKYLYNPKKEGDPSMPALGSIFSSSFSSATLEKLSLHNGELVLQNLERSDPDFLVANIEFGLVQAYADTSTIKRFSMFDYQDITMRSTGLFANFSKEYHIVSDTVWFDAEKKIIRISSFQVQPQFNREAFAARYDYQKNWMALTVDELSLRDFNFDRFSYTGEVHIGIVSLVNPNLALYKDKTKPLPPYSKKFLPASNIKKIPWPITVDTTLVKGATVTINEKSKMRAEMTDLTFNQIEATISGFSNNPRVQRTDQHLIVEATGRPMNAVNSALYLDFDLESETDEFTARGKVYSFEPSKFNKVFAPGLGVRFIEGNIDHVEFEFQGMDTISRGSIDLHYSGMKIEVLKSDEPEKSGFLSLLANTIIKTNNDPTKNNYTQGIIESPRDQTKGLFPFIWHSLRSGLISTFVPFKNSNSPNDKSRKKK